MGMFTIVYAEDEADLVIKNIAANQTGRTLILSMDTDYLILSVDLPHVDVGTLDHDAITYNPYQNWRRLFPGI
jgi:hypothetical protein